MSAKDSDGTLGWWSCGDYSLLAGQQRLAPIAPDCPSFREASDESTITIVSHIAILLCFTLAHTHP